jgi:hypothetical protein
VLTVARSNVVWLLTYLNEPVAAFTVKHELISWLAEEENREWHNMQLYRMKDGPHPKEAFRNRYEEPKVTELDIGDVMK